MGITASETTKLRDEDFLRLGVAVSECRSTVIRKAATKNSKSLSHHSDGDQQQLVELATSTYRLLDPRQRTDPGQRSYVGRILPLALMAAAKQRSCRKPFHVAPVIDKDLEQEVAAKPSQTERGLPLDVPVISNDGECWHATLGIEDLLVRPRRSRVSRFRGFMQAPPVLLSLIGFTLAAAVGLAIWVSSHPSTVPLHHGARLLNSMPDQRN